jgi:hypothetical protein
MGIMLTDTDVRRAAHGRLLSQAKRAPGTLVIDELGLDHGTSRIDIAVINGHIRGLEIKAEADRLSRLPQQVIAYGKVVDKASLIVAPRHLEAALSMLPDWWGVIVATRGLRSGIVFTRLRKERRNRSTSPKMRARLLWRPEAVKLLRELGLPESDLRGPREELYTRLVTEMPRRHLATKVREALKCRVAWRDRPQPL